jgi:F-type H+-transporting ATPase subunit b
VGFSWTTFLFEVVNFVLLLWLLQRLLYKPLQSTIEQRREARRDAEHQLEALKQQAQQLVTDQDTQRHELERLRESILAEARAGAQAERAGILRCAESEATDLRRRERERLTLEKSELDAETASESLVAARASVESLLRAVCAPEHTAGELDAAMTRRLLAELDRQGEDLAALASDVELRAAVELNEEQKRELRARLSPRLPDSVSIDFIRDPSLISGLVLRAGDRVYDASLLGQVERLFEQASRSLARSDAAVLSR